MLNQLKTMPRGLAPVLAAVTISLAMLISSCGGDGAKNSEVSVKAKSRPVATPAPAPQPVIDTAPAPIEKEVAAVAEIEREVSYDEAEAAFTDRRYTEAVELFTRYTAGKSENPWGYYMLGLSEWKAGDAAAAESAFTQSLALDPNHVKSLLNLSRVLLESARPDDALVHIGAALDVDPENGTAYRLQGRAFYQKGTNEQAIASYRSAIQLDSQDAWAMNNLALILIEEERFEDAIGPLARAVEIQGDVAVFHNNLGMALERTGRFAGAVAEYETSVALDGAYEKAVANHERLSGVAFDPDVTPVDLAAAAADFASEITSWNDTVALGGSLDESAQMDDVTTAPADTTETTAGP